MALARLHGGPLDGQILPLDDVGQDVLIVPYSETQVVYSRQGAPSASDSGGGPAETPFRFVESESDISPSDD